MQIAMAVHGGAWAIPDAKVEANAAGCERSLRAGLAILQRGGSSLDAVQTAVAQLEDDATFDAGFGSFLNEDGLVQCDAGLMDGHTLNVGSVAAVSGVRNPVVLARQVLESPYAFIVGDGARRFAERSGVPVCDPQELATEDELARWKTDMGRKPEDLIAHGLFGDTVGAVAVDSEGHVAAATSTGGTPNKPNGRVGDSPIIGTGVFADDTLAAVSTTGHGEAIIPLVWARTAAAMVRPEVAAAAAARRAVEMLARSSARGGLIMVDPSGRIAVAHNTPRMAYAFLDPATQAVVTSASNNPTTSSPGGIYVP